jgi:hypothetical protein
MIRYSYNRQIVPPAPFIHVTLRCVDTGREMSQVPAQLDIAADRSVLPGSCVEELALVLAPGKAWERGKRCKDTTLKPFVEPSG